MDANGAPDLGEVQNSQRRRVVQLSDELDRMIKLVAWTREELESTIYKGQNFGDADRLRKLASTLSELVNTKIRLDKNQKDIAETMTPEQEVAAISKYIRGMDPKERARFLNREMEYALKWELDGVENTSIKR